MKNFFVRKIQLSHDFFQLETDLESFCRLALESGASDAKVIPASQVSVDPRVRMKCYSPRCHHYGRSAYCPPHTPGVEEVRNTVEMYQHAILVKYNIEPVEDIADPNQPEKRRIHGRKLGEIISKVEAMAFSQGYYLAWALGAGSCRMHLCNDQICQVLDSNMCRHGLSARPSMEALGLDVFRLATQAGWEMYPIGFKKVNPSDVPCGSYVGIIFII